MSVNLDKAVGRHWRYLLACLLLVIAVPAAADVYTYVDADGNRVFTDQPHASKNAKRVDLPTGNRMAAPAPRPTQSRAASAKPKPMFNYQLLRILVPEPDATVRNGDGNLIVTVTSDPVLQDGHLYRLRLDDKPMGEAGRSPVFPLNNIDRGTHQLSVEIIDGTGRVMEKTPDQPFHMLRISLAQKRQANPCSTEDFGVRPECPLQDKPEEKSSILPFL